MIFYVLLMCGFSLVKAQFNLCPAPDGDFPNPASEGCTTFFRCANGQATMLRCPSMQKFDFLFRSCRSGTQLHCERQLEVFAVPTDAPGDTDKAQLDARGSNPLTAMIAASGVGANLGGGGVTGGLRAGLSGGVGLLNALALLEDGGGRRGRGRGGGDNSLATMLILSTLINQMNPVQNKQRQQQPPQQPGYQQFQQQHYPEEPGYQQPQQQQYPQQPGYQEPHEWNKPAKEPSSAAAPSVGLYPASAVLPTPSPKADDTQEPKRQTVTLQGGGGQITRLPDGKTVVVITQPQPASA